MDSKSKKKIILVASLLIILLVVILNLNKIKLALDVYNIYNEEKDLDQASEEGEEDFDSEKENPLKPLLGDEDEEDPEETIADGDAESAEADKLSGQGAQDKPVKQSDPYIAIIDNYNGRLEGLQSSFQADINGLVSSAMDDYKSGSYSKSQLASKYLSAGSQLESASDKRFNALIQEMEGELESNGFDKEIVDEISIYYSNFKNAEKRAIISHGMSLLD